jgi:hypothetical protein
MVTPDGKYVFDQRCTWWLTSIFAAARRGVSPDIDEEAFVPKPRVIDFGINYVLDVTFVHQGVAKFTQRGLETNDGSDYEFDLIACVPGFRISYVPPL